jgi:predicted nuclease of restriction endonuclease-like RecB superfamily
MSPEGLEQALYADLRAAHLLRTVRAMTGPALVLGFDLAQAQAVLLRAVRVVAFVGCEGPGAYRALFGKLKFLRLLHRIERAEDDTYRIEIDGPFSLFESVTRYGLQLALSLPIIASSAHYRLEADVRWGKEREALTLRLEGGREHSRAKPRQAESLGPSATAERSSEESGEEPARLADEVEVLLAALEALCEGGAVRVARCYEVLHVPGASVCVPDLVFEHRKSRRRVYLEVMGYWSRDAVWKRVELIEGGLDERVLFAVGKHLRVSEAALDDEASGALYVYKRTMHARTVLERVEALLARKKRESKPAAPST